MKIAAIYRIYNNISGRSYVGSSINIKQRKSAHFSLLRKGKHHAVALQRSWIKHGSPAFVFEILEPILDISTIVAREQWWIDHLNAADACLGFNVAPAAGSPRGFKHSDETRAKQSAIRKGKKLGPFTEQHRAAISASKRGKSGMKGIPKTPEHRAKLSMAKMGKSLVLSEQTKARIRESNTARNKSPEMRRAVSSSKLKLYQDPAQRERLRQQALMSWNARRANGEPLGRPHTQESKERMSAAKKGKMSDAHKAAIAASNRNRVNREPAAQSMPNLDT